MREILAFVFIGAVACVAKAEDNFNAYADGVLTCKEMHANPYRVFNASESVDLGSGHGSPVDVEYNCDGGLASVALLKKYLSLADIIRSEEGPMICTGSIVYAHNRYYRYALLEAGLAPENMLAPGRQRLSQEWESYFKSWGHKSRYNFNLYRSFLEEERIVRPKLIAHFERKYRFQKDKAAQIADSSIGIIKDWAAGSFPGSSEFSSRDADSLPEIAGLVMAVGVTADKLSVATDDSLQEDIDIALKVALLHGKSGEILTTLIKKIKEIDQGDESSLFFALKSRESVDALLRVGANVNYQNGFGKTPIYYAIEDGNIEIVERLIKSRADVNHRFLSKEELETDHCRYAIVHFGRTPLMHAAQHGGPETIKMLVKYGARINDIDDVGFSVLDYASQTGKVENEAYLRTLGAKSACQMGYFSSGVCVESNNSLQARRP